MSRRYALRDDQWERIKDMLPGREGTVGVTATDNRLFVEAVVYRYRPAFRGAICRNGLGTFARCILVSAVGPKAGFGKRSLTIWRTTPTMNGR